MIPSNIQKAEKISRELDNTFLALYQNHKEGCSSFDFYVKFEELLTITGIKADMDNELKKYYSVMMDLFRLVGRCITGVLEVDEENLEVVFYEDYDFHDHYNFLKLKSFRNTYKYPITREKFDANRNVYEILMKPNNSYSAVTKYRYYVNRDNEKKYSLNDIEHDKFIKEQLVSLFERYDQIEVIQGYTFEKYVEQGIEHKTNTENNAVTDSAPQIVPDVTFNDLFNSDQEKEFTLRAMRDLKITDRNDRYAMGDRQKSYLFELILIFKKDKIISDISPEKLTKAFCERVGLKYTKIGRSDYLSPKAHTEIRAYLIERI